MTRNKLKKIYLAILSIFIAFVVSFYFLAGEQLWFKKSDGSIKMLEADSISEEINKNNTLYQTFVSNVDKITSFEFVFTKNYQEGDGRLVILLTSDYKVLGRLPIQVKDVPEQHRVYLELKEPIEDALNKEITIKMYSTSKEGEGVHAMMNSSVEDSVVKINNQETQGTICFSIVGYEEISTAPYYWIIMGAIGIGLAVILSVSYKKYCNGKTDYIVVAFNAVNRYKFLISQLVSRDFKSKYKRSIFGILWSFLNPLLTMTVQFLVFSTFFKTDTQNYPVYLISGVVCFSFFNECTTMCLNSISSNYRLITKVYIPKYIFPLAKTISSSINLGISLIPLLLVTVITGTALHWSFLLMFYFLICLIIFSLGIGMILATLMVFFRDIQFLWSVVCTIWQYATPIFYPAEIIPDKFKFIVRFNPLYHFIGCLRKCLIDGISPEPIQYVYCLIFALGSLFIGSYIFKKCQDKFTLYL